MFQDKIKDVFFDLDHTLWDFDRNSALAFDAIFKKNKMPIDIDFFIEKYVPINQACWKLYQNDKITHEVLRYNRLKHTFDAIDFAVSDATINQIADEYIAILPESNHLFDGAIAILEYLKKKYTLHIITNGFAEVQDRKISNSRINHYFETITNSELAGAKKPNPIIFDYALQTANAQKESSLMIGDCLDADVQGALSFGMEAFFYNPNGAENPKKFKEIKHLLDLKNHL
jgi:YjjG family noncanonical pyrimidine nucleotidase